MTIHGATRSNGKTPSNDNTWQPRNDDTRSNKEMTMPGHPKQQQNNDTRHTQSNQETTISEATTKHKKTIIHSNSKTPRNDNNMGYFAHKNAKTTPGNIRSHMKETTQDNSDKCARPPTGELPKEKRTRPPK
ncbi:hypothetical protein C2G38_2161406 [Gigaspora rosea]|uniref:Uncharacterized protein n=1 Tax=Gigaspora rosea TaxID=44941 RepID=A0A397VWZ4_9GLOM|nr:hypothetical protein C2G38_2161406 [Gigaspora rosea]